MGFARMAEVWRGPAVESVHYGVAAVANAAGDIIYGWGDTGIVTFPRSSLKPIQALALIETGAADAFNLQPQDLALACASHRGEAIHTVRAGDWLHRIGLTADNLACGPDYPSDEDSAADHIRSGTPPSRLFHNCSGKHCGYLTVARHMGWPVEGYDDPSHPTQQLYFDNFSELLGEDARKLPMGIDGCTLPAPALSMSSMARCMARFASAHTGNDKRDQAIHRLQDAMRTYPELVAGTGQPNVALSKATGGRVIMKGGAEGYLAVFIPDQGLGIALKVADGNSRARVVALLAVLRELKLLDAAECVALADIAKPSIRNSVETVVGRICACTPTKAAPT